MFKLTTHTTITDALSRVEDLIDMPNIKTPSHLVYSDGHVEYTTKLDTAPEYFSYVGWYKYLADNLDNLKFINERAVYQLVDLPMVKTENFINAADLIKRNDELTGEVSRLTYELTQVQELNIFTGVLFSGVYPIWTNEAEFKQLDDYKYLSQVLDRVVDTFDHNFQKTYIYGLSMYHQNEHSSCSSVLPTIIQNNSRIHNSFTINISIRDKRFAIPFTNAGPWIEDLNWQWYHAHMPKYTADVFKQSNSAVNDSVFMYIVGVLAGWIHLNIAHILPYEYLVFIDCDPQGVRFKLVTLKKHAKQPARFLFDWRRFIVTGC